MCPERTPVVVKVVRQTPKLAYLTQGVNVQLKEQM